MHTSNFIKDRKNDERASRATAEMPKNGKEDKVIAGRGSFNPEKGKKDKLPSTVIRVSHT